MASDPKPYIYSIRLSPVFMRVSERLRYYFYIRPKWRRAFTMPSASTVSVT